MIGPLNSMLHMAEVLPTSTWNHTKLRFLSVKHHGIQITFSVLGSARLDFRKEEIFLLFCTV